MKLNVWMKLLWNSWNLCFYACYVLALHPLVDLFIGAKINCLTTLRQLKQEQTEKTTKNLLSPNDNLHAWLFGTACFFWPRAYHGKFPKIFTRWSETKHQQTLSRELQEQTVMKIMNVMNGHRLLVSSGLLLICSDTRSEWIGPARLARVA